MLALTGSRTRQDRGKTGSGVGSVGIMDELEHRPDRDAGPQRDDKPSGPAAPAPGRRRLLTGGLSATGVVLTLASRPVLGQCPPTCSGTGSVATYPQTGAGGIAPNPLTTESPLNKLYQPDTDLFGKSVTETGNSSSSSQGAWRW